jgi:hypothetical protein
MPLEETLIARYWSARLVSRSTKSGSAAGDAALVGGSLKDH